MGFFSKVFGKEPRKDIDQVADSLCRKLTIARVDWFNLVIGVLQRHKDLCGKVVNTELGGEVELGIKGLQLGHIAKMIYDRGYLHGSIKEEFYLSLTSKVCGPKIKECVTYVNRYLEAEELIIEVFSMDVAKYICGQKYPEDYLEAIREFRESLSSGKNIDDILKTLGFDKYVNPDLYAAILNLYNPLLYQNLLATALSFGDMETASHVTKQLENL